MALNKCVAPTAPCWAALRAVAASLFEWPSDTRTPLLTHSAIMSKEPDSSGATVKVRTMRPEPVAGPRMARRPATEGACKSCFGSAPAISGFTNGPSRWMPATRATPDGSLAAAASKVTQHSPNTDGSAGNSVGWKLVVP